MSVTIEGTGSAVPDTKLTNADLEALVDTSDEWIVSRTGIRERGKLGDDQATSDLATLAAERALESAGVEAGDIDLIVVATCTGDMVMPSTAALVQRNLRVGRPIPGYDLNAACSGFVFALQVAYDQLCSGRYRRALLIGADAMTRLMDYQDRTTCVLFGDGAGALVLEAGDGEDRGLKSTIVKSDGEFWDVIHVPAGGSRKPVSPYVLTQREQYLRMNGRQTFKLAVQAMEQVSRDALAEAGWGLDEVDHVIVHQANRRIIEAVAERLGIDRTKIPQNVERTGNTSAASIPILIDECHRQGTLARGDKLLCAAFGSGMSWGASGIVW